MKRPDGFTLLELMIAILLFAMISTAAYKLFDSVTRAQLVTEGIFDRLDEIQRAQVVLEKDLLQIASRPIRNEFGDSLPALLAPNRDGQMLEFTRTGWRNPLGLIRSDMQRVAYDLEGSELVRYYWLMLDRAPDPVLVRQVLLDGVQRVRARFMDEKKRWQTSWPPQTRQGPGEKKSEQQVMPHAIELTVYHVHFGAMVTMLPLMDYKPSEPTKEQAEKEKQQADKKKSSRERPEPEPEEDDNDDDEDDDDEGGDE